MFLNRLANNKYVFFAESLVNNTREYGFKNAVKITPIKSRSLDTLKKDFKNSCALQLIEKSLGSKPYIDSAYDFGYCIAPVIYDYIKWLCSSGYNEIWFLSREGWLLKKAFDLYCHKKSINIKSVYFLASRRAASVAAIKSANDIKEILCQYYRGSLKNLLYSRLGINVDCNDFKVEMPKDIERVMNTVNISQVIKRAEAERKNYIGYIGSINSKITLADIGYQGTIQYYISKILNKKISGSYICTHYKNKPAQIGCDFKGLYNVINMREEQTNGIFKNQLCFEAVLKAPFGQLVCFDDNFKPVYNSENDFDDFTEEIQRGILKFIDDASDIDNMPFVKSPLSAVLVDVLINNNTSKGILDRLRVEDKYCSDGEIAAANSKTE